MKTETTSTSSRFVQILSWVFFVLFVMTGILNLFLIHVVPGTFYLFLSILYLPITNMKLKKIFGFTIPSLIKTIVGLVVLWGTLAVGDLAEILGL